MRPRRLPRTALVLSSCLAGFAALATVSSRAQAADKPAYKLELEKVPEVENGKIIVVEGKTSAAGDKYYVEFLSILQPVTVTAIAKDPAADVELALAKYRWDDFLHEASTRGQGTAQHRIRTEGELRVVVTGEPVGTPYQLVIWAGDEVKPDLGAPVVSMKGYDGGAASSEGSSLTTAVAAIVTVGLVLFVIVMVVKRKKQTV